MTQNSNATNNKKDTINELDVINKRLNELQNNIKTDFFLFNH